MSWSGYIPGSLLRDAPHEPLFSERREAERTLRLKPYDLDAMTGREQRIACIAARLLTHATRIASPSDPDVAATNEAVNDLAARPSFHACRADAAMRSCICGDPLAHRCWPNQGGCGAAPGEPCVVSPPATPALDLEAIKRRADGARVAWFDPPVLARHYQRDASALLAEIARLQQRLDQLTRERGGR